MGEGASTREKALKVEEVKAIKLFIFLFYSVFIGFDFVYYYLYPYSLHGKVGLPAEGLGFFVYILLFLLLPVAIYFISKGHPFLVKYVYFISYILLEFINNMMIYWEADIEFLSGNIVEILFLLFAPLFVNKRFFWVISIVLILKYCAYGVLFKSINVFIPIVLILFFSIFGYILLLRFISYINGMVNVYEDSKQKEKLAVVGQMAASIAHEIKNPLSALKGFTQLQQEKDSSNENYYPIMLNEIDRINFIVSDLLLIGKPNFTAKKQAKVSGIIEYVVTIMEPQAGRLSIHIQTEMETDLPEVYCDENQLKQVFINLLKNSLESMPNGGNILITASFEKDEFIIRIQDEGEGIPKEMMKRLGEPFFTTKQNGTGLGLMVTKKIIEEHGGKFIIQQTSEEGTIIDVVLPLGE